MQIIGLIVVLFFVIAILQAMQTSDNVLIAFIGAVLTIATAGTGAIASGAGISAIATPIVGIPAGIFIGILILKLLFR